MPESDVLTAERVFFQQHKSEWLQSHPGDFVVIVGEAAEGFFSDYETAFRAGLRKVGLTGNFLVKQVCAEEPVYLIY